MMRSIARKESFSSQKLTSLSFLRSISSFLGFSQNSLSCPQNRILDIKNPLNFRFSELGLLQYRELLPPLVDPKNSIASALFSLTNFKGFATAADEISSNDVEEQEMESLSEELSREGEPLEQIYPKKTIEMGRGKYQRLRRRQAKIETEAWEEAAKEYREFLADMCEQKLAPNLPYIKSLFLGWFEPLRDEIAAEQQRCKDVNKRAGHSRYFDQLPAEIMAVITMHKLMSLMMTGDASRGGVPVVHAACQIGEAVENEVGAIIILHRLYLYLHWLGTVLIFTQLMAF